jgi:hypothetical protein
MYSSNIFMKSQDLKKYKLPDMPGYISLKIKGMFYMSVRPPL